MKTIKEILKMTKAEVQKYKWSNDLNPKSQNKGCFYCFHCYDCSNCFHCFHCSICSSCSDCSDCYNCSDCSNCYDCSDCSNCYDCSDCYNCRNAKGLKYAICNIEVGKEAYEKWMNENAK